MARKHNVILPNAAPDRAEGFVMVCLNRPTGIKFRLRDERTVTINGNAADLKGQDMGVLPVGAYGMTLVSNADWEEIKATYGASLPIFARGLIFAGNDTASAVAEARDKAGLRNGFEPVEQGRAHTSGVQPAEVM